MFVKRGSKGTDVETVQKLLNKHGYGLVVDGDFGGGTHKAVVDFQEKKGLVVDGKVGDNTFAELTNYTTGHQFNDQPWIEHAKHAIGIKEIKGNKHHPEIVQYWKDIKRGGIKDDETPWCAAFVGAMLERSGIKSSRFESAKSYLDWGVIIKEPVDGCIVVFSRNGGGHVGFVVGEDTNGNLLVLGGNQKNAVNVASFNKSRVKGYRYPRNSVIPLSLSIGSPEDLSHNEA